MVSLAQYRLIPEKLNRTFNNGFIEVFGGDYPHTGYHRTIFPPIVEEQTGFNSDGSFLWFHGSYWLYTILIDVV